MARQVAALDENRANLGVPLIGPKARQTLGLAATGLIEETRGAHESAALYYRRSLELGRALPEVCLYPSRRSEWPVSITGEAMTRGRRG
jgi:hypothetical protein